MLCPLHKPLADVDPGHELRTQNACTECGNFEICGSGKRPSSCSYTGPEPALCSPCSNSLNQCKVCKSPISAPPPS